MGKKTALLSALGGQGTTLTAACMGLAAAALGHSVTMLDLCGFGGTLARTLCVSEEAVMYLGDVLRGSCAAEDAMIPCAPSMRLIASSLFDGELVDPCGVEVRRLVEECGRMGDVIADWPAGRVPDCGAAGCFDEFVICACADRLSLQYAAALRRRIRQAAEQSCRRCGVRLLLTRFSPEGMREGGMGDIDECIDTVGAQLLGVIPFDEEAARAVMRGGLLPPNGGAMDACRDAVRRLYGEKVPLDMKTSLWGR